MMLNPKTRGDDNKGGTIADILHAAFSNHYLLYILYGVFSWWSIVSN
jgi:hypothetical protein